MSRIRRHFSAEQKAQIVRRRLAGKEPVSKLAEELRRVGAEIKRQAEQELADLYPTDPDGATPIAYLWARTVSCESPNCEDLNQSAPSFS